MEYRVNMVTTVNSFTIIEASSKEEATRLAIEREDDTKVYHAGQSSSWHAIPATADDMRYSSMDQEAE